eukprot:GSChrysophyteH1.ASY1.ANO1.43.1 assembled CDS
MNEKGKDAAISTFIGNVLQKAVTFVFNTLIVRKTNPSIFGVAAVQLELFLSTLLFLSREGIRLAVLKQRLPKGDWNGSQAARNERQKLVNLSWLPALLLVCAVLSIGSYAAWDSADSSRGSDVSRAVVLLYCTGALLECCAEPWINQYQLYVLAGPKVRAEGAAVAVRALVTYISVAELEWGVFGFGVAQVFHGLTFLFVAVLQSKSLGKTTKMTDMLPSPLANSRKETCLGVLDAYVDREALRLAITTTSSSVLKHTLTEADRIVLTTTRAAHDQGVYAVVSNYGGLVARLLYQPLEDSCRLVYSRLVASQSSSIDKNGANAKIHLKSSDEQIGNIISMIALWRRTLLLTSALGVVITSVGPAYVRVFNNIFMSAQWRRCETVETLCAYCYYILIMGINGCTEAFVYAVAPSSHFVYINLVMIISTIVYALAIVDPFSSGASNMNTTGAAQIVYASALGMAVRAVFAVAYGVHYFKNSSYAGITDREANDNKSKKVSNKDILLADFSPSQWGVRILAFLATGQLCSYIVKASETTYFNNLEKGLTPMGRSLLVHVASGVACAVLLVSFALFLLAPTCDREVLLQRLLVYFKLTKEKSS